MLHTTRMACSKEMRVKDNGTGGLSAIHCGFKAQQHSRSCGGLQQLQLSKTCHPFPFAFQQTCHLYDLQGSTESLLSYFTAACLQSSGLGSRWRQFYHSSCKLRTQVSVPARNAAALPEPPTWSDRCSPVRILLAGSAIPSRAVSGKPFFSLWARGLLDEISCIPLLSRS